MGKRLLVVWMKPNILKNLMNTDGPDCPLARVYSKSDCESLFNMFSLVDTKVYFFDKSHWSFLSKFIPKSSEFLGRTWGWHRIVFGQKL